MTAMTMLMPRPRPASFKVWLRNLLVWRKLMVAGLFLTFGEPFVYLIGLGFGLGRFIGEVSGMTYLTFLASGLLAASAMSAAAFEGMATAVEVDDPAVAEALEKINSVGAYEVPALGLRKDENYASTAQDVEPYRGVRPFKEHFLLQMQYTGPGRAIPEPENLDSVQIGFIGPIMATVSVATGGRRHEEPLGIPDAAGRPTLVELRPRDESSDLLK